MRTAGCQRRDDDGGEEGAAAGPSLGAAWEETCKLQLIVWEQWL
ncbi:hypothetical protein OVA06_00095 [Pseudarthrobacter sp. SL88]|nr:hypothetical protein [Pseudarthrobacter sp. SL88]MCY1673126.1 hypothetical protein [Pseudarthrobacter sp. SL88]